LSAARLLSSCRAVVYDLDGTLVDTLPDLSAALNAALAEHGLCALPPRFVRDTLHGGFEASVQAALAALRADAALHSVVLAACTRHYAASPLRRTRLYPGVRSLLAQQRGRGVKLALCTNRSASIAERVLSAFGLRELFGVIVGADTCAERKPHPAPLLYTLAQMQIGAADAVLVGDSVVDVQCAHAAGVACLLFTRGYGAAHVGATPVAGRFDSHMQLLDLPLNASVTLL
jgi:phosphoglycolate phosphatase